MMSNNVLLSQRDSHIIKGIAIALVVVSHIHRICMLPDKLEPFLNPCGYLGVALFLFISGYGCMSSVSPNSLNTLYKRIFRVVKPLFYITVITFLLMLSFNETPSIKYMFLQSVGLNNTMCSACWYITFQYFCYIGFLLLGKESSFHKVLLWALTFSLTILLISCLYEIDGVLFNLWGLNAFSFCAGVSVARMSANKIKKISLKAGLSLFVTFVCLFVCAYFVFHNPEEYVLRNPLKSMVSLSFVLCICFLITFLSNKDVVYEKLGETVRKP